MYIYLNNVPYIDYFEFLKSKLCKIMQDEEFLLDYEEEQAETKEHAKNDATSNGDGTKKIKVFKL